MKFKRKKNPQLNGYKIGFSIQQTVQIAMIILLKLSIFTLTANLSTNCSFYPNNFLTRTHQHLIAFLSLLTHLQEKTNAGISYKLRYKPATVH